MINANEQRVIAAASGTFEYEGKMYRAKASYISQLTGKLDRENVDLSAADADAAIGQIMANVATGVKQGYLEEAGNTGVEEPSQSGGKTDGGKRDESRGSKTKKSAEADGPAGQRSGLSEEGEESPEQTPTQIEESGSAGEEAQTGEDVLQASPEPVQIDLQAAKEAWTVRQFTANSETAVQTGRAFGRYETTAVFVWLLCVAGSAIFLKKIKRRKKLRAGLAGVILTGSALVLIGFGYLFGSEAFSGSRWEQVVTESAYLNESSRDTISGLKKAVVRAGLPETALDGYMDENAAYRDAKVLVSADGDAREKTLARAEDVLARALAAQTSVSGKQRAELTEFLIRQYEEGLTIPWLAYLQEKRDAGRRMAWIFWISGMACMAAAVCILLVKTRYRHRAVRGLAMGCLNSGAGFALAGAAARPSVRLEPEGYDRLINMYVRSVCQSGLYFGILLLCAGLALGIVSYFMKTRIE